MTEQLTHTHTHVYIYIHTHTHICSLHICFIYLSVAGHLNCLHSLTIVNNAAMNIGVHISFQVDIFVFYKSFFFPISSGTFVICCLFDDNHSCRWEVISHCGFDLHFFDD